MPPLVIAAAIAAGGAVVSAKMSSNASNKAAKLSTDSANHAADVGKQTNDETLAFQKQQAEADWRNQETAQKANYAQYMAKYNAVKGLGGQMGFNLPDPTPYAGSEDPHYDTGGSPLPTSVGGAAGVGGPAAPGTSAASGNPTDPNYIASQLENVYKSLGVQPTGPGTGPTDIAYMADKVLKTGGWTAQNASYWPGRIKQELALAKSGGAPAASGGATGGSAPLTSSVASFMGGGAPTAAPVSAAQLQPPPDFRLRGVSSYLGGRA